MWSIPTTWTSPSIQLDLDHRRPCIPPEVPGLSSVIGRQGVQDFDRAISACGAIAPIGEGPDMSQFMLVEREVDTRSLLAVAMSPIDVGDEFVREVATEHFGDWRECRLVTDASGGGESLIDDLSDAQMGGAAIEDTKCVRFLKEVVESGVRFVIWHGSDYRSLPTAHSWSDVLEVLRSQTRLQPADVYLSFVPPGAQRA
jgi:hypothetical protein